MTEERATVFDFKLYELSSIIKSGKLVLFLLLESLLEKESDSLLFLLSYTEGSCMIKFNLLVN